jgi:hypothetical protein
MPMDLRGFKFFLKNPLKGEGEGITFHIINLAE